MSRLILAGDVGGTKTWLGLFAGDGPRPSPRETRGYPTREFDALTPMVARFLEETGAAGQIAAACFGVAGPVQANVSQLTTLPWVVDAAEDVGGGIAPRILPALRTGRFIEAFVNKGPHATAPGAGSRLGDPRTAGGADRRRD